MEDRRIMREGGAEKRKEGERRRSPWVSVNKKHVAGRSLLCGLALWREANGAHGGIYGVCE